MTADALRLWQVWSPLARWRAVVILGLLVQLALLREVSEGRFLLLSRGGEAVRELWYLHTFTKVTIFASLAHLVGALVEQRFRQTSLLTPRWMWRVSVLHIGAMGALLFLLPTLPIGFQDTMLREVELWRYAAASSVFFAWQWTAVLLIAPSMLIRGMRVSTSAFLLCAIAAAIIPAYSPNPAPLSALGGFASRDVLYVGL